MFRISAWPTFALALIRYGNYASHKSQKPLCVEQGLHRQNRRAPKVLVLKDHIIVDCCSSLSGRSRGRKLPTRYGFYICL
jgi:hypothetical protein